MRAESGFYHQAFPTRVDGNLKPWAKHILSKENASCPVEVAVVRKVANEKQWGKPGLFHGKSFKTSTRGLFLVLPQRLTADMCRPRIREGPSRWSHRSIYTLFSRFLSVPLSTSPFSAASFTLSLKLFWFSLTYPAVWGGEEEEVVRRGLLGSYCLYKIPNPVPCFRLFDSSSQACVSMCLAFLSC